MNVSNTVTVHINKKHAKILYTFLDVGGIFSFFPYTSVCNKNKYDLVKSVKIFAISKAAIHYGTPYHTHSLSYTHTFHPV